MKPAHLSAAALLVALLMPGQTRVWAQDSPPDTDAIARTLVVENTGIEEGDKVLILGPERERQLLEDLNVQVRKAGAFPLLAVTSDQLERRLVDEVPSAYDAQTDSLMLELMGIVDAQIFVAVDPPPDIIMGLAPERLAARFAAFLPIDQRMRERDVRFLEVGNQLFPTAWRAEQFQVPRERLASMFWEAVAVDYGELERTGSAVRERLESGGEVHVTHTDGTDLRFRIEGRQVFVNDGVISDEDRQRGGAAVWAWVPAGGAYTTAVPGSARGTIVVPHTFFFDQEVTDLRLEFQDGLLTAMSGSGPGFERYKSQYEAGGEGRNAFGILDIGLNPRVMIPEGSRVQTFLPAGSVTLGYGNDLWAGGENDVNWGDFQSLQGATLSIDGEPLIEVGRLVR